MAFYSTEKAAIVLDIGCTHVRVGLAGEPFPRATLASSLALPDGRVLSLAVVRPTHFQRGSDPEWREATALWLRSLVGETLQVDPTERRLVVAEDVSTPSRFRNALAHVALAELGMVSLLMHPAGALGLLALRLPTALVVDVGGAAARTLPVVDSMPLLTVARESDAAGALIDANIGRLLRQHAKIRPPWAPAHDLGDLPGDETDACLDDPAWREWAGAALGSSGGRGGDEPGELPRDVVEDFKVKACFVRLGEGDKLDAGATPPPDTSADVHLSHGLETVYDIQGCVRGLAAEVLFHSNNAAEIVSLPELVLLTLVAAPMDVRGTLAQNIVVIGGSASLPGLHRRLGFELDALVSSDGRFRELAPLAGRFRFVPSPHGPDHLAWTGASLVGAMTEYLPQTSISRDEYLDEPKIPDWSVVGSQADFAHLFHDL
ncbi:uncharacterized protein AMSG_02722 [Thecamonas trahens ATCC 50062]|uniref:Actin n=1 Tax=Thecamonas trahens ATCC 50062 TaxID=461836 RepID=A0A0L0D1N4_THETB|nr:hypothetical protein AMSG_02722 [Thecamonas trahens ATCC 50062]KNC46269.1 hypothetical protein AMSG_02722 [Thecamonas trahens ATCC 50062]|eukprot:XP_013760563.1 hypothetical protein AMSG_02722 [Thecamonas trahens ATCC 50062]